MPELHRLAWSSGKALRAGLSGRAEDAGGAGSLLRLLPPLPPPAPSTTSSGDLHCAVYASPPLSLRPMLHHDASWATSMWLYSWLRAYGCTDSHKLVAVQMATSLGLYR